MQTLWHSEASRRATPPPAFTLIEVMGVLAILTLLGALALPAIIRQVDHARLIRESADLATCSEALTRSIVRTKIVPVTTGIPNAMASESALTRDQITTTPIGTLRGLLMDPSLGLGSGLPYTQSGNLGIPSPPTSARVLLVSSLSRPNPLSWDETNSSAANFNAIWATPQNTTPSTWVNWRGTGDDLRIQRINLAPLFHRLLLVNHDPDHFPRFAIDTTTLLTDAPTNTVWEAYYLDGSVVGLYVGANLQTRHVLTSDISFVFENGLWSGMVGRGAPPSGLPETFARSADQFLSAALNSKAPGGVSQLPIVLAMASFMQTYSAWANGCPHFSNHGAPGTTTKIAEYQLLDSVAGPIKSGGGKNPADAFLDNFTGTSGLLK